MPKRILVVEDEEILRVGTTLHLKSFGYEVVGNFRSGEDAIENVLELKPDLVLMDINLSGDLNGIETVKEIRKKVDIPVIYLSVYSDAKTIEEAKATHPFRYMIKPFNEEELKFTIETAIKSHKQEKQMKMLKDQGDVLNNVKGIVYRRFKEDLTTTLFCDLLEKITGFNPDEIKSENIHFLLPIIVAEDQNNVINTLNESIELKNQYTITYRIKNKNGEIKKFWEIGTPLFGNDGEIIHFDGTIFDITGT